MAALWRAAAFVAGVCLLQNQAALPPLAPSLWAVFVLLLAAIAFRALRLSQGKIATIGAFGLGFLLCFAVGLSWANWRAHDRLRPLLPSDLRWQDIVVEGRVDGLATIDRNAARFDFAIDKLVSPPRPLPAFKARISYRPHAGAIRLGEIRDGARLRLKVRIREPRSNFNPNGFDYAGWLFARKIRYGGYTRSGEENRLLEAGGGLRESLRARIAAAIPGSSARAIVAALAIGDRSGLSDSQWESMRRAGVVHLVSISAVHIGFVFGVAFLLCRLALLFLRRYFFVVKGQTVACLVALAAAGCYAALAGFQIPTQRALIMLAAGCAAALWGRRHSMLMPFSLALFAVVAFDPWAVLAPGFWLSFFLAGIVLILFRQGFDLRYAADAPAASAPEPPVIYKRLSEKDEAFVIVPDKSMNGKLRYAANITRFHLLTFAQEWEQWVRRALLFLAAAGLLISLLTAAAAAAFIFSFLTASLLLRVNIGRYFLFQILISAGAIPLTFGFFGEGSIISPIANFFAIPAVGLTLPFVLADVVLPGDFLWRAAAIPLAGFEWATEELSSPAWAAKFAPTPTPILFALAVGGALWLLAPVGRLRWFGALPLCALAFTPPIAIPQGDAAVATLDVGQGSAIVVRTANRTLVYDAGPRRGKIGFRRLGCLAVFARARLAANRRARRKPRRQRPQRRRGIDFARVSRCDFLFVAAARESAQSFGESRALRIGNRLALGRNRFFVFASERGGLSGGARRQRYELRAFDSDARFGGAFDRRFVGRIRGRIARPPSRRFRRHSRAADDFAGKSSRQQKLLAPKIRARGRAANRDFQRRIVQHARPSASRRDGFIRARDRGENRAHRPRRRGIFASWRAAKNPNAKTARPPLLAHRPRSRLRRGEKQSGDGAEMKSGAVGEIRTPDLLITNQLLYRTELQQRRADSSKRGARAAL